MSDADRHSSEMTALFARADKALAESRRLAALVAENKALARDQLDRMYEIGREFRPFVPIRYPNDPVDARH